MTEVKVYSTPNCLWCKKAKEWLKEHNIPYIEYDVASDLKARNEMIEKSGQLGVPVIIIDSKVIVGFDEEGMKKALKIK